MSDTTEDCTSHTKVSELQVTIVVDQQVLWLEIAMDNACEAYQTHN